MKVLIISECSKKALKRTRQIVDQFAPRIGRRTWCTEITAEGLKTLHSILKRGASKLTAVSCFWQKKNGENELLWIVGRRDAFNFNGIVPICSSECLDKSNINKNEDCWIFTKVLSCVVAIASLFHDFGKCSILFQKRLRGENIYKTEPFRHEYVSALYFFCILKYSKKKNDFEFFDYLLEKLNERDDLNFIKNIENYLFELVGLSDECQFDPKIIFEKTHFNDKNYLNNNFSYTFFILWLIINHHRLAEPKETTPFELLKFVSFDGAISELNNSHFSNFHEETKKNFFNEKYDFWKCNFQLFDNKSLFQSELWRNTLKEYIKIFLDNIKISSYSFTPFKNAENKDKSATELIAENLIPSETLIFTLGRVSLVIADHECSSNRKGIDNIPYFDLLAKKNEFSLRQQLDEHCVLVAKKSEGIVSRFTKIKGDLPCINLCRDLRKNSLNPYFNWQNKAFNISNKYRDQIQKHGFFGINIASTGRGKTLANMRIIYGLSEGYGFRTCVLLGLRTLTNQTGESLKQKLGIDETDIATITGESIILKNFFNDDKNVDITKNYEEETKIIDGLGEHLYVTYSGAVIKTFLTKYLDRTNNSKVNNIINAPILVSTIDMLINGLESRKAAHMLPSIVRLLSSDLIIDEVDDYNLTDLPAISRLIYYAGMFGAKVLLSSATLPRILIKYLFDSYTSGRALYNKSMLKDVKSDIVMTGFFDEYSSIVESVYFGANSNCDNQCFFKSFYEVYSNFYDNRIEHIASNSSKIHIGKILEIKDKNEDITTASLEYANYIFDAIIELHELNKIIDEKKQKSYSLGIVRFAHINEMINVFKKFKEVVETRLVNKNTIIKTVIYHSRYTALVRSEIERRLDNMLNRTKSDASNDEIQKALDGTLFTNVIVVVFASPVAEVGRDHDYDWAVVEPSSMRSIIQLIGRVQRHRRNKNNDKYNFIVLSKNFNRYKDGVDDKQYFVKPGYEITDQYAKKNHLESHDLIDLKLDQSNDFKYLNSNFRLRKCKDLESNFLKIEILAIDSVFSLDKMSDNNEKYKYQNINSSNVLMSLYWKSFLSTTHITQKISEFRKNDKVDECVFVHKLNQDTDELSFYDIEGNEQNDFFVIEDISSGIYCEFLFNFDEKNIIESCQKVLSGSENLNKITLRKSLDYDEKYFYNINYGFFKND